MEIHILASGSTGNATLIRMGDAKILVDAGISARRIKKALDAVGTAVEDLDAVLVTHEHRDHVCGLPTMVKKYRVPVYARPAAWAAMDDDGMGGAIPAECRRSMTASFDIGGVKAEAFSISHDAADPVGFSFFHGRHKCSVATDLGFVTETVKSALALSDVLVLEANHDIDMLRQGSYPWFLKKRIMSNRGHLANTDAGWTLARLARKQHCHTFLAHMSQENNRPELAEETVAGILAEQGCRLDEEVSLALTFPDQTASFKL